MRAPPGDEPLGITELAAMFGRKRRTVEAWRYQGLLPQPDVTVGQSPGWYPSTLRAWGIRTGRLNPDGTPVPASNRPLNPQKT